MSMFDSEDFIGYEIEEAKPEATFEELLEIEENKEFKARLAKAEENIDKLAQALMRTLEVVEKINQNYQDFMQKVVDNTSTN